MNTDNTEPTMKLIDLPAIGQPLEGGEFAGVTTTAEGTHCAIVLLADKPEQKLSWQSAMTWAEGLQATLPTRPVAALLFMHLKARFEEAWYWTAETAAFDGSCAWHQHFPDGDQNDYRKSYEGRARAVRLIQLIDVTSKQVELL